MDFAPLEDIDEVLARQSLVAEALKLEADGNSRLLGGLTDPRPYLQSAAKGQVLSPEHLLDIELLCSVSRDVHQIMRGREDLPGLLDLVIGVVPQPKIEQLIRRSITRDGRRGQQDSAPTSS